MHHTHLDYLTLFWISYIIATPNFAYIINFEYNIISGTMTEEPKRESDNTTTVALGVLLAIAAIFILILVVVTIVAVIVIFLAVKRPSFRQKIQQLIRCSGIDSHNNTTLLIIPII